MNDRKHINWNKLATKALVVCSMLFILLLGINYRPAPNFDYSAVKSLETENGAIKVDFDFLGGFDYEKDEKIPVKVKNLNGKTIKVIGFMLPVDFDSGAVKSFMLLKNQMGCCFGIRPRANDYVYVEMPEGKSAKYIMDTPLKITGKLEIVKENLVGGLYSMSANKVEVFRNY